MQDFLTIKQEWGSEERESMADYTARFEQLLPYGGPIYQDPVAQRDHYINGLRPQLYKSLCTVALKDRWEAYHAAMNLERADQRILEQKVASKESGKRKVLGHVRSHHGPLVQRKRRLGPLTMVTLTLLQGQSGAPPLQGPHPAAIFVGDHISASANFAPALASDAESKDITSMNVLIE
ncbi:hypothetical protein LINPERHAP1_LOCUS6043 [Linum perenne]